MSKDSLWLLFPLALAVLCLWVVWAALRTGSFGALFFGGWLAAMLFIYIGILAVTMRRGGGDA